MARIYDVVRITALPTPMHVEPDGISVRVPRGGDIATIVEVDENPYGYELECSRGDGMTEWLRTFAPGDVEFEKIG